MSDALRPEVFALGGWIFLAIVILVWAALPKDD
jgi:hypothetical protein